MDIGSRAGPSPALRRPAYIARHGAPREIGDLAHHICLPAHNNESWKLEGPGGSLVYRPEGPLVTNSSEIIRAAVIAGAGIAPPLNLGRQRGTA